MTHQILSSAETQLSSFFNNEMTPKLRSLAAAFAGNLTEGASGLTGAEANARSKALQTGLIRFETSKDELNTLTAKRTLEKTYLRRIFAWKNASRRKVLVFQAWKTYARLQKTRRLQVSLIQRAQQRALLQKTFLGWAGEVDAKQNAQIEEKIEEIRVKEERNWTGVHQDFIKRLKSILDERMAELKDKTEKLDRLKEKCADISALAKGNA